MWPFKKPENPLVRDTLKTSFYAWLCRRYGHLRVGPYYQLPQASCRRCGAKLSGASDFVPEWSMPWDDYLNKQDRENQ